jgi:hypothetical protein
LQRPPSGFGPAVVADGDTSLTAGCRFDSLRGPLATGVTLAELLLIAVLEGSAEGKRDHPFVALVGAALVLPRRKPDYLARRYEDRSRFGLERDRSGLDVEQVLLDLVDVVRVGEAVAQFEFVVVDREVRRAYRFGQRSHNRRWLDNSIHVLDSDVLHDRECEQGHKTVPFRRTPVVSVSPRRDSRPS